MTDPDTLQQIAALLSPAVLTILGVRTTLASLQSAMDTLRAELAAVKVDLADLRARYAVNHPAEPRST